jgi:hypothetical protein
LLPHGGDAGVSERQDEKQRGKPVRHRTSSVSHKMCHNVSMSALSRGLRASGPRAGRIRGVAAYRVSPPQASRRSPATLTRKSS